MSPFRLTILAALAVLLAPFSVAGQAALELKTQNKIAKGAPAIFKAKALDPHIRAIRLRFKNANDSDFRWVDFKKISDSEYQAQIEAKEIAGSLILYYIVIQKDDGTIDVVYGSQTEPHRLIVDRRIGDAVIHQKSTFQIKKQQARIFEDRFGDDSVLDQMTVFAASDLKARGAPLDIFQLAERNRNTLAQVLVSTPSVEFSQQTHNPVLNGFDGTGRTRLRVDGLEVVNEFDGSSFWCLDTLNVSSLSISDELINAPGSLLGGVNVLTPKKRGIRAQLGFGYPFKYRAGLALGQNIGAVENYLTFSLNDRLLSAIVYSEYDWGFVRRPFLTNQFQLFAKLPKNNEALELTWNARVGFELPLSNSWDSRLFISAGQTLHDEYKLIRAKLHFENDINFSRQHVLNVFAQTAFVGLVYRSEAEASRRARCEALGLSTTAMSDCRVEGWLALSDRFRHENFALTSSVELVGATREENSVASIVHPGAIFEFYPIDWMTLILGYRSTVRWPTFAEKIANETVLVPETFRVANFGTRFGFNSEYAKLTLDLNGQSAWLGRASDVAQSFGFGGTLAVDLASASQLYVGAQHYTQTAAFPPLKLVLGGRLNLLEAGSLSLELQNHNRFYFSYQTRPFLERFVLESQLFQDGTEGQYQFMATVKLVN